MSYICRMLIPARSACLSGKEIEEKVLKLSGQAREDYFLSLAQAGNVPDFYRQVCGINLGNSLAQAGLEVACDYLCFGEDDDYVYAQVNIETAQKIADVFDMMLPTPKLVDEIWKQAAVQLRPLPWGPPYDNTMFSSRRLLAQSRKIEAQRRKVSTPLGALTAGNFKDYVLVDGFATAPKQTCIYGWQMPPHGTVIQYLALNAHERVYTDYSQAPRFCGKILEVRSGAGQNCQPIPVKDAMQEPDLCTLISNRGICNVHRLPGINLAQNQA